ncbi:hypothetical protein THRCLA_21490, partial [Thraustotheca clavata]
MNPNDNKGKIKGHEVHNMKATCVILKNEANNIFPIVHATIVDICVDPNQGTKYEIAIDTGNFGTLHAWHGYSTYCSLAKSLKSKKAHDAKVIPELPRNCCSVNERMVALNRFFRTITHINDLHWGIRIDEKTTALFRGDNFQLRPSIATTATCSEDGD